MAKQLKSPDMQEWFGATPPIEAPGILVPSATSVSWSCFCSRALLYAPRIGSAKSMRACTAWYSFPTDRRRRCFYRGQGNPTCMVHGDDFVVPCSTPELLSLRPKVEGELEIATTFRANGEGYAEEVNILSRILMCRDGASCEADLNHAEVIIQATGAAHLPASRSTRRTARPRHMAQLSAREWGKARRSGRHMCRSRSAWRTRPTMHGELAARARLVAIDRGDFLFSAEG